MREIQWDWGIKEFLWGILSWQEQFLGVRWWEIPRAGMGGEEKIRSEWPLGSKAGWFYDVNVELRYPSICCVLSLGMPGSARSQLSRDCWVGPSSSEIWALNEVTAPGRAQMDVLRAVMCLSLCFPRIISTSHPRTEATVAGWHGKMDAHCSVTGLQPF